MATHGVEPLAIELPDLVTLEPHPPLLGAQEPPDQAKNRGFTGTRSTDERNDAATTDREADVVQNRAVAVTEANVVEPQKLGIRHGGCGVYRGTEYCIAAGVASPQLGNWTPALPVSGRSSPVHL